MKLWPSTSITWLSPKRLPASAKAVAADPQFAMAHELLAQISLDSAEQVSEQQRPLLHARYASPV